MSEIGEWVRHCQDVLYDDRWVFPERPDAIYSFGKHIAEILADPDDEQHAAPVVVGQSGSGKSTVALSIALSIARNLAEIFEDQIEDHFDLDTHVCILDENTADNIKRMCAQKMRQVFIIDEAGDDTNARRAMSRDNIDNVIFMATVRTSRSCIIRCVQYESMLDGGIMKQMSHLIRIVEPHHKEGYNTVKIKTLKVYGDNPEPYKVYLKPNGRDKLVRHNIYAPDPDLYSQYKKRRKSGADTRMLEMVDAPKDVAASPREITRQKCERAWADYMDVSHPYKRLSRCALDADVDPKTLQKWMGRNGHTESERVKE